MRNPVALLLWVLSIWGGSFALRGYWEPDEARFVYVAREMAQSGNWLVPQRHGQFYAHKPPLMFWLINLGEAVFPEPFGSRLPSFIGVLLALWAMNGIASLWRGGRAGLQSVIVLSSAWMFWSTCGMGQIDGLLIGLEMSALFTLLKHEHNASARFPWVPFILMGLAVLAKGPVGLIIPFGVYLAIRSAGKAEKPLGVGDLVLGLVVSLLIPLAWIELCWLSGAPREYLHELLFTQNVSRAAGELGHRQPAFYYLFHAPVGFLPWTLFLPVAFLELRKTNRGLLRKLVAWILFVVVFFSIPSSKRNLYILFSMPGMALLVAAAWEQIERTRACKTLAVAVVSLAVAFLAGLTLLVVFFDSIPALSANEKASFALGSLPAWPFVLTLAAVVYGLCRLTLAREKWLEPYAYALCAGLAVANFVAFPAFNTIKVPHAIGPLAEKYIPPDGRLLLYGIYGESLALHSGRRGMRCDSDAALIAAMNEQQQGLAVFLSKNTQDINARFPSISETGAFRMGSKKYVWAAFETPEGAPLASEKDGK